MHLYLLVCIPDDFVVGLGEGMTILHFIYCLLDRVVLEASQIEGYHLGRPIDACRAVHIHLLSLLQQLTHHLQSSSSLHHKVLIIHVQNRVFLVFYITLLADELDVMRGETMLVEILFTLYGENGRDFIFLQFQDISLGFGVAAYIYLRSDARKDYLIHTEFIHNNHFSPGVCHLDPMLLRRLLVFKLEHPPWFSLTLHLAILLDV